MFRLYLARCVSSRVAAITLLLLASCVVGCGRIDYVPRSDGGTARDAAPIDAGPSDAGGLDAGDAGRVDAGPVDAGRVDAGPVDAGVLDAGLDAGSADSGIDGGVCSSAPACARTCTIDVAAGTSTCTAPEATIESIAPGTGTVRIDMTGYTSLLVTVDVCDPASYWFHLGDSPTDNGGGGDSGSSSNDAELQMTTSSLAIFNNDVGSSTLAHQDLAWAPASGCSTRSVLMSDSRVSSCEPASSFALSSATLLRINPPTDLEGTPDALWWLGLNRTYGSAARTGTGLRSTTLCFVR